MNTRPLPLLACSLVLGLVALPGCERRTVVVTVPSTPIAEPVSKTTTLETERLGKSIDLFDQEPTADHRADVKKALARLDEEIAELDGRVARTAGRDKEEANAKLHNLQTYRASEYLRFTALEARASVTRTGPSEVDSRSGGEKVKEGAKDVGGAIKDGAKEVGSAIKDAVRR